MRFTHVAIAAPTDLVFGMARMYEGQSNIHGMEIRVFHALDEARDWLMREVSADFEPIFRLG